MSYLLTARMLLSAVMGAEHLLEKMEAALAIAAGEKQGVRHHAVRMEVAFTTEEFVQVVQIPLVRQGMVRAQVMKDAGEFHAGGP